MRKLMLLVVLVLLVFMPRCDWLFNECYLDSDCDDDNPCTRDDCEYSYTPSYSNDPSCLDTGTTTYWCAYSRLDDGTPCDADGEPGMCTAGECQPSGEVPEPILDGGVL